MLMILLLNLAFAKTIKVAVLDSGYNTKRVNYHVLGDVPKPVENDDFVHGTPVVGLIKRGAGAEGYCFYVYKVMPG